MTKFWRLFSVAFGSVLAFTSPIFAAGEGTNVFSGSGIGAGIGAGLILLGAGYGFGKIGSSGLESMARQPERANQIQIAMIIIGALLEGATLIALLLVSSALVTKAAF